MRVGAVLLFEGLVGIEVDMARDTPRDECIKTLPFFIVPERLHAFTP
jgi:hypothetical protein